MYDRKGAPKLYSQTLYAGFYIQFISQTNSNRITRQLNPINFNFSNLFNHELYNYSTVSIFFQDTSCIKYRRDMYMTWDGLFGKYYN